MQGQPGANIVDFAFIIDKVIFSITQVALLGIFKGEISIIFAVMPLPDDLESRALERIQDWLGSSAMRTLA